LVQQATRIAVSHSIVTLIEQLCTFMFGEVTQLHLPNLQALERISNVRVDSEDSALGKTIRPMLSLARENAESNVEISVLSLRLLSSLS
jgi:hypothetical protein